jgi:hypothetical protein
MRRLDIATLLKGGDRRSIGRSEKVNKLVSRQPGLFAELLKCLWDEDPVIRMRAADAAEKITLAHPELWNPHKQELLGLLDKAEQIALRWHLALVMPRLKLSGQERARAATAFERYLEVGSSMVKTFALQALVDLARQDARLQEQARRTIEESLQTGTAAMKARARKLLRELQN